eukprot:6200220-Alexandrium_andersonii.AAC.1
MFFLTPLRDHPNSHVRGQIRNQRERWRGSSPSGAFGEWARAFVGLLSHPRATTLDFAAPFNPDLA